MPGEVQGLRADHRADRHVSDLRLLRVGHRMNPLLGAFGLGDCRVADVLTDADGLASFGGFDLGGTGQQGLLVIGESNGQNLSPGVTGGRSSGSRGHAHEVTVSQRSTNCYTTCDTESIAGQQFVLYDKSMNTTVTVSKMGRDIQVGDVIDSGRDGILVAAFRAYDSPLIPITGPGRVGYNASGVEIAIYDNHPMRVRVVGDIACTHREATREHLDSCCAEFIDCDRCSQPITGLTGHDLEVGEAAVCTDCGFDRMDALGIEAQR